MFTLTLHNVAGKLRHAPMHCSCLLHNIVPSYDLFDKNSRAQIDLQQRALEKVTKQGTSISVLLV
jgi:hypothetical protein